MNHTTHIYAQQKHEPDKHYELFVRFKKMGKNRSFEQLANEVATMRPDDSDLFGADSTDTRTILKRIRAIAHKREWNRRLQAWLDDEAETEEYQQQEKFLSIRKISKQMHFQASQELMAIIYAAISQLKREGVTEQIVITTKDGNIKTSRKAHFLLPHIGMLTKALETIIVLQREMLAIAEGDEAIYDPDKINHAPEMDFSMLTPDELATVVELLEKARRRQ